ncbi:unnamed protein product, partial [Brassica oleracea]
MISRQPYGSNHFSDSLLFDSITKLDFTTTGAIVDFLEFRDRSDSNTTSGKQLASGGSDNVVHVWDAAISSITTTQWLHRLGEHTCAVKALAWCPFQSSLLATGGGGGDGSIKFWNTHTGACVNSVHTGSQVCALFWSKKETEL